MLCIHTSWIGNQQQNLGNTGPDKCTSACLLNNPNYPVRRYRAENFFEGLYNLNEFSKTHVSFVHLTLQDVNSKNRLVQIR